MEFRKKQKYFVRIFISILVIFIAATLLYFLRNNTTQVNEIKFQTGSSRYFTFSYPENWRVSIDEVKNDPTQIERLMIDPYMTVRKPHDIPFMEAQGGYTLMLYNSTTYTFRDLISAEVELKRSANNVKKLGWKTGEFNGQCFESSIENLMENVTEHENIDCFIVIPYKSDKVLYHFAFSGPYMQRIDPNKMIAKTFIESLQSNTNSSAVYKNSEFGFQFEYNKDSKIIYEVREGHQFISGSDEGELNENPPGVILKIEDDKLWITDKDGKRWADDIVYLTLELEKDCGNYSWKPTNKVINGLTFQYRERKGGVEGKGILRTACLTQKGKSLILTNATSHDDNIGKTEKLFNQILYSFKLTQ